jgi:hypothetical protein
VGSDARALAPRPWTYSTTRRAAAARAAAARELVQRDFGWDATRERSRPWAAPPGARSLRIRGGTRAHDRLTPAATLAGAGPLPAVPFPAAIG